jgi:hypothetical protein
MTNIFHNLDVRILNFIENEIPFLFTFVTMGGFIFLFHKLLQLLEVLI